MTEASRPDARVLRVALEVTRQLDADACLEALARGALDVGGGSFALAYLVSSSGEDLECIAAIGRVDPGPLRRELSVLDAGLIWHLAPRGAALLDRADILLPTGPQEGIPPLAGGLLVPLLSSNGPAGLLLLIARPGESFDRVSQEQLTALAAEIPTALDNLRSVASLRDLVIRDDTADCYNRRYLDHSLEDEVERARRFGGRLALIFLDMDNLKDVNTNHGHAAGSRVLYEASLRIGASVRSIDRLFRYGGDEFVVLLPGTGLNGARAVAERVRRELAARPFELTSGAIASLTASAGVAAWPEHGPTGRKVVEAADAAMRVVKRAGKNAVGVAPESGESPDETLDVPPA